MTKFTFNYDAKKEYSEKHHLKKTWANHNRNVSYMTAASVFVEDGGDMEYVKIFEEHFPQFSGKILEIGAGTGFFAKKILKSCKDVDYTILDIEKNMPYVKKMLSEFSNVNYITSDKYKEALKGEYDLFIETHCLSETPRYYYLDILENLSTKSCLVIDYGGDPNDPGFDRSLGEWFGKFNNRNKFLNQNLLGAKKRGGIPVYIGKE